MDNKIKIVFLIILLSIYNCDKKKKEDKRVKMVDDINYFACYIANYDEYNRAIYEVKRVSEEKDTAYIKRSAKELLGKLESAKDSLLSNTSFLNVFEFTDDYIDELNSSYRIAQNILSEVSMGVFSFEENSSNYETFDYWRDYYVKEKSKILFNDWFLIAGSYYLSKEYVNSLRYNGDFFLTPYKDEYVKIVNFSYQELIHDKYVFLNDIKFSQEKTLNEYDKLVNSSTEKYNTIIFW